MARELCQTSGFIIGQEPRGEASRLLLILTRHLGLIKALAQGVRSNRSKLRGYLQVGWLAEVDLIRGRDYWRVTGATAGRSLSPRGSDQQLAAGRLVSFFKRLIPPEEPNPLLFSDVVAGFDLLTAPAAEIETVETILVLRTLQRLGYFDSAPTWVNFTAAKNLTPELIEDFKPQRRPAIKLINEAISASHL